MFAWLNIYHKIQELRFNRKVEKARKETEAIAHGFWELYYLALTFHGRKQLSNVIGSAEEGSIEVDPMVLSVYRYLLIFAPYQQYATIN